MVTLRTLRRWLWVLALAVMGAACFELLLAVSWTYGQHWSIPDRVPTWTLWIVVVFLTTTLLWSLIEPLRIGRRQLRYILSYPPGWLAIACAFTLVVVMREVNATILRPAIPVPVPLWVVGIVSASVLVAWGAARRFPGPALATPPESPGDDSESWTSLEMWALAESPSSIDLFAHRPVATRIAEVLSQTTLVDQSVGLVGEFGSGKSTILRWVETDLQKAKKPRVVVAWVSCWGFSDSASMAVHVMERLVERLQDEVDLTAIRGLPEAYRRMMAPEKLRWLERLVGTDHERDVLQRLKELPEILAAMNLRIVVFVEDADRVAGAGFDPSQLERLLWILKEIRGVTFVLAISRHSQLDISKLCDHVEILPRVNEGRVAGTIAKVRDHWQRDYTYVLPGLPRKPSDPLELEGDKGLSAYLRASSGMRTPSDVIADLLRTPRRLKHVVRRVHLAWVKLHGEVDLNDLIIVNVLREGAPEVLDFMIWNIDAARQEPSDFGKAPKEVHDAWIKMTEKDERAALAAPLVDVLGIRQLSKSMTTRLQGLQDSEPTDYFRRILSEDVDKAEVRDQEVLRDIADWLAARPSPMLTKLGAATERHERYVDVWEYFAGQVPNDRLNDVVDGLFAQHIAGRPVDARLPALMSCWRQRNKRGDRQIVDHERLLRMIRQALFVSLPLVNDLYYFWTSVRYGPFSAEDRAMVRRGVVDGARECFVDAPRLITALDVPHIEEPHRWALRQLVEPADQEEPPSAFRDLDGWQWLAAVLMDAVKISPVLILGQSARLVGDLHQQMHVRTGPTESYELRLPRVKALFADRDQEFLEMLAGASISDDWVLAEASRQSAAFLKKSDDTPH